MDRSARLILPARALLIAAAGGVAATLVGLPASWLTGAMAFSAAASIAGLDMRLPPPLITFAMILIGTLLGAGATPEIVARATAWPLSVVILGVSVVAVQLAVQRFLTGFAGWDRTTAFFAAIPGAVSYVVVVAAAAGADVRKVAVSQSLRVFLLVALLPTIISAIESRPAVAPPLVVAGYAQLALLLAAATAGGLFLNWLRMPAGLLCGALAASAILHATGLVVGTLPLPGIVAVFVILGAFVGSRFVGTSLAFLGEIALASLGAFLVAIAVAVCFAGLSAAITKVDLPQVLVAFAPGGLDSMTSLAIALHMDVAFVAVHQLARFVGIALTTPIVVRAMRK